MDHIFILNVPGDAFFLNLCVRLSEHSPAAGLGGELLMVCDMPVHLTETELRQSTAGPWIPQVFNSHRIPLVLMGQNVISVVAIQFSFSLLSRLLPPFHCNVAE